MVRSAANPIARPTSPVGFGALPRAAQTARAGAPAATPGDSLVLSQASAGTAFDNAFNAVKATHDPAEARAQIALMQQALPTLKRGAADEGALLADLAVAQERAAALPYLQGTPVAPRPTVVRTAGAISSAQAAQARAWLNGYAGTKPSASGGWLQTHLPGVAARLGGASEPTPAFTKLPAADQAKVLELARLTNADGQFALHQLLVSGKLTPALLNNLTLLASQQLAPRIDAATLVSQTLSELADPVSISQKSRGTCSATCTQIMIALRDPNLYVSLLRGLAAPAGQASLPGGAGTLRRVSDWNADNDGGRSIPGRLFQPALLDFGNGDLDYSNTHDMDVNPVTRAEQPSGLVGASAAFLLNAVTADHPGYVTLGDGYVSTLTPEASRGLDGNIASPAELLLAQQNPQAIDPASQDEVMAQLVAHAKPNDPVYCTVIYTLKPSEGAVGYHAVLVTGVKNDTVSFINPWGREETLPAKTFKAMVVCANLRSDEKIAQAPLAASFDQRTGNALYGVRDGDTLYTIAAHQLGDARRWTEIAALNGAALRGTKPDAALPADASLVLPTA